MVQISTVILVHGAWANAMLWAKVLPPLAASGIAAMAAQLPLTSLAADMATLRRAIALARPPVLLVGHGYGGVVITEAGVEIAVAGLVYIAGFAPGAGESAETQAASGAPTALADAIRMDRDGFAMLTRAGVAKVFAPDLSPVEAALLHATQGPIAGAALAGQVSDPGWRTKPSWYLRATEDRVIDPALQEIMARRIGACTHDVASSHVPMLSQPEAVIDLIEQACR